jgi:acrylyl-CoA reductase (NADPH)
MTDSFKALMVEKTDDGQSVAVKNLTLDDLMDGDVVVSVSHSTVNYKDGMVLTGAAPVVRKFPMIGGIDLAGTVESSEHPRFKAGDQVLLNGYGLSETHFGGYAAKARVKGDWLVKRPAAFSAAQSMAIGTAGYTAMLCVLALEKQGVTPDSGPIVVTGASGGVGGVAIAVLSKLGYEVVASTGRTEEAEYLKALGANDVIDRNELSGDVRPMGKERWGGGVDSVGSNTLANVLGTTRYGGSVAACGLAQGMDLPAFVTPFILRGVSLLGIDSVQAPMPLRVEAWDRLAMDLDISKLEAITTTIGFDDLPDAAQKIMAGKIRGRLVVDI